MNELTKTTVPLPVTTQDLLDKRKSMRDRTLNDYVMDIHEALWETPAYHRSLESVYDEDAIEGSLAADNFVAATLIRDYARKNGHHHVKDRKLATIVKSLNVVLRRYGIARKDRAVTISGEKVQNGNNDE